MEVIECYDPFEGGEYLYIKWKEFVISIWDNGEVNVKRRGEETVK